MATDIENLRTRRSAILAELAALSSTASGGRPNYNVDGQSVDHVGYKDSLYRELKEIDALAASIEGPVEIVQHGYT